jgi:subtilisin-like proprotein convertase family protein
MQPKFTQKKFGKFFGLTPLIFVLFCLFSVKTYAQPSVVYQTTDVGNTGAEITATANGAAASMGDAIVMAGTNRYINRVEVKLFTLTSLTPFNLTLRLYTDCSTDGSANSACGNGPGVLVPNSTLTLSGITPAALGTVFTVVFNYTAIVNLTAETDNQINVVLNASRNDVFWILNETPVIGSLPPGEGATSVVTRCGSSGANNGCARDFGINNNFNMRISASATPCSPVNAGAPTISSVPSSTCAGSPITLSILGGALNGASDWVWYSGASCGGTPIGTGNSITVSPVATTTYSARGEGGCAPGPGACGSQVVTVTPCTCISPDVSTICLGSVQRLAINQTLPAITSTVSKVGAITVPGTGTGAATGAPANPYPDVLAVSGLPSGTTVSSVTINGFTHTFPSDVDIVLRSPSGQNVILMSDAGGGVDAVGLNLTFSDGAATVLPATLVSGTFRPTNTAGPDAFPAPGPGSITQVNPTLSSFAGSPNGNWELFVVDDLGGDIGTISGWSITFAAPATTATWTPATTLFTDPAGTIAYVGGQAASVVYAKPTATGASTYVATVNNGPCAGANNVTVNVLTTPVVTVSPNPGGCSPATLTASGASIYNWTPATGLSAVTGATVVATTPVDRTYTVTGIGTNGCTALPVTVPVTGSSISAVMSSLGAAPTTIWSEGFTVAAPLPVGWASQNLSAPVGTTGWFQGNDAVFPAQSGAPTSYIGANFNNTAGAGTISNWLFTPVTALANGDQLTFWTRTTDGTFPDRLQVRMSTNGASVNAGASETSVGDFTTLLLDINPTLTGTGYPTVWTQQTATVAGLSAPTSGRLAFRYFVTNGGPTGANSDYIGIDNVSYLKPPLAICANTLANIKVDITGGVSPYTLVYTNGTTNFNVPGYVSGSPINVFPGTTTTTYTIVSVTGANGCAGSGNTGSAVITITPPPSITTQPANRTTCAGLNPTFTVAAGPALGTTYQWQESTNGGSTYTNLANVAPYSGVTTNTLTITGATTAQNLNRYRVIVSGVCPAPGSSLTSTAATLFVNANPTIVTQPVATTRCVGTAATFTVVASTPNGPAAPTYQWQVSINSGLTYTNISGATSATLTIPSVAITMNNNLYQCIVTAAPCATTVTTTPVKLTVNTLPVITIAAPVTQLVPGRSTTITATSTPGPLTPASFSWTQNGTTVTGATTSTLARNIDQIGTYRATITDVNGCVGSSNNLEIGTEASDQLWIYPNPTDGVFQVRLYFPNFNTSENRVVSVWNANGQMVDRKTLNFIRGMSPYTQVNFDLSKMAAGTYLVKVTEQNTEKIVSGLIVIQ